MRALIAELTQAEKGQTQSGALDFSVGKDGKYVVRTKAGEVGIGCTPGQAIDDLHTNHSF